MKRHLRKTREPMRGLQWGCFLVGVLAPLPCVDRQSYDEILLKPILPEDQRRSMMTNFVDRIRSNAIRSRTRVRLLPCGGG